MIRITAITIAVACVLFTASFKKAKNNTDKKDYGIVAVIKSFPRSDRTTIIVTDLEKLDELPIDTYECVLSHGSFCKATQLDIIHELNDEQNLTAPYGKWLEKISFDIASDGADMKIFNSKCALKDFLFDYLE